MVTASLWLWGRYGLSRAQKAMRWWQVYQATHLHHCAEGIRNGDLQDLFALRRTIELLPKLAATESFRMQTLLGQVSTLHQDLEALSDELSPPFVTDSFPFALKNILEKSCKKYKQCPCRLSIPEEWPSETIARNHLLIKILQALIEELCTTYGNEGAISMALSLRQDRRHWAELRLTLTGIGLDSVKLEQKLALKQLLQVFEILMPGRYSRKDKKDEREWKLRWKLCETEPAATCE